MLLCKPNHSQQNKKQQVLCPETLSHRDIRTLFILKLYLRYITALLSL